MCFQGPSWVCDNDFIGRMALNVQLRVGERRPGFEPVLRSTMKFVVVSLSPETLRRWPPWGGFLERIELRSTRLCLSPLLGPSAAERGLCRSEPCMEGRDVRQLPPPRRRGPQGWVPGSAHPAPGPGRGGAGRRQSPAVPLTRPLPSAARAGVSTACGRPRIGEPSRCAH